MNICRRLLHVFFLCLLMVTCRLNIKRFLFSPRPIFEFTLVVKEPSDRITLANFSSSGAVIFTNSKGEIFSAAAPDYR